MFPREDTTKRNMHEDRLTVRLNAIQSEKIEMIVTAGLCDTKVDFVRKAIDKYLSVMLPDLQARIEEDKAYILANTDWSAVQELRGMKAEETQRLRELLRP